MIVLRACLFTLLIQLVVFSSAHAAESVPLLLEEVWEARMQEFPQFATHAGDMRFNDRLEEVSIKAEDRRAALNREFLSRLQAIPVDALSKADRLERDLLERDLKDELAEYEARYFLMPINGRTGFHISFPELPQDCPLRSTADYENYLDRLRAFRKYANGHIDLMREGIRSGLVLAAVILEGWEDTIDAHIVEDPKQSLLFKPFKDFPKAVPESEHERLRAAAEQAITRIGSRRLSRFPPVYG